MKKTRKMITKVKNTIYKYNMLSAGDHVTVGLSGGADSMCLLYILNELSEELKITVSAAHMNHQIRGDEALRDENFVINYCKDKNITIYTSNADIPALSLQTGESIELTARKKRYEFLQGLNCDKIATAHTGSDRVETLLMNLSRGSGLNGLCSIPPVRDKIIRPLIDITRREIEEFCEVNSVPYINDSSNFSDEYTRNYYRINIIPLFKSINPCFEENALRCINSLNVENSFIFAAAQNELNIRLINNNTLSIKDFCNLQQGLKNRVLMLFFDINNCCDYETKHINFICDNICNCFSLTLPHNKIISCDANVLCIHKETQHKTRDSVVVKKNDIYDNEITFQGITLCIRQQINSTDNCCYIADADKIDTEFSIRHRITGDKFSFAKRHCTKSLKKLFNELKVPVEMRDNIAIIADINGMIFLEQVGVDASRCISEKTKNFLIIKSECDKNE